MQLGKLAEIRNLEEGDKNWSIHLLEYKPFILLFLLKCLRQSRTQSNLQDFFDFTDGRLTIALGNAAAYFL